MSPAASRSRSSAGGQASSADASKCRKRFKEMDGGGRVVKGEARVIRDIRPSMSKDRFEKWLEKLHAISHESAGLVRSSRVRPPPSPCSSPGGALNVTGEGKDVTPGHGAPFVKFGIEIRHV